MASVVFIIRVPYEGNSESTKAEAKNESFIEETEGEGLTGSTDEQNVKEVKFEIDKKTDKRPNENEVGVGDDTNEADQSAHDVEMFTGPLNLAQVGVFTWKIFHYFMTENNNKNNKYIYDHCDGNWTHDHWLADLTLSQLSYEVMQKLIFQNWVHFLSYQHTLWSVRQITKLQSNMQRHTLIQ